MLSEFALMCHESAISDFKSLCIGGENFEHLSPRGVAAVSDMLSTIRELQEFVTLYHQIKAVLASTQARVAELETDAKLGRMVREMPIGAGVAHCDWTWAGSGKGAWVADWPIGEDRGATVYNRQYGDSAKAALDAARKEEG